MGSVIFREVKRLGETNYGDGERVLHPDAIDIVRSVLFDADTHRAYDHAIYEAEVNQE